MDIDMTYLSKDEMVLLREAMDMFCSESYGAPDRIKAIGDLWQKITDCDSVMILKGPIFKG